MSAVGRNAMLMQRLVLFSVLACPTRAFSGVALRKGGLTVSEARSFHHYHWGAASAHVATPSARSTTMRLQSSSSSTEITHIGLAQMQEIIEDYEEGGREDSQYCVIDVRTEDEVAATGKVGENVYTLPVQIMGQYKVLEMEPDEFLEFCKFEKPSPDETIVFTCAAGIRSVYACQYAAQAGYTKIINYTGGASEWFSPANNMR